MLLRTGIIVAFFILLSRFFGLAREFFIATTFGTSALATALTLLLNFPIYLEEYLAKVHYRRSLSLCLVKNLLPHETKPRSSAAKSLRY
jgi:peptidoglycan biosynthesis protein MviN/MurJ (putative lipid II flippase)